MPVHTHAFVAARATGNENNPGAGLASETSGGLRPYVEDSATDPMWNGSAAPVGGSQPHTNFQPYLCIGFIISFFGIFPSPT